MENHNHGLGGDPASINAPFKPKVQQITWDNLSALPPQVEVPHYDRSLVRRRILHFGPSKFALSHWGTIVDSILHNDPSWGIVMASIRTGENALALKKSDGMYVVVKHEDGVQTARVVGSIVDSLYANGNPEGIIDAVADQSFSLITFTITAAGYYKTPDGNLDTTKEDINNDLSNPHTPMTIYPYLVRGLEKRAKTHGQPVVLMSLDNMEANSATLRQLLLQFIQLTQPGLKAWVEKNVSFPVTLVDRITPDVSADFRIEAQNLLGGMKPPMLVRTEGYKELVVERTALTIPWDKVGVKVVDDCGPHWQRKFYALNAAHQVVAIPALRLGIRYIHEAMQRAPIAQLLDVAHHEYQSFLGDSITVLEPYMEKVRSRFSDASNPDTASRVAARTTEKVSDRLAAAILRGLEATGQVASAGTFVIAVWALNLGGHDEFGQGIDCRDDAAGMLGDLHRRFLDYARIVARKGNDLAPFDALKSILLDVAHRLSDNRFARLAGVESFVRRLSLALGQIESLGLEDAVDPYLHAV